MVAVTSPTSRSSVTPSGRPLSPITQFLNVPSLPPKKASSARVLTSTQAIALMEEKIRKKEQEQEAKEARKKEREEKKLAREQEARKKAAERQRKAEAKQEEARRKAEEKERKAAEKRKALLEKEAAKKTREEARKKRTTRFQQNKENVRDAELQAPSTSSQVTTSDGDQQNECSVCMGKYEDDFTDGELQNEWICCTGCGRWMHVDCLVCENSTFMCVLCNVVLK